MKLLLATQNTAKISEFQELLDDIPLLTLADFRAVPVPTVEEAGSTYFENALVKALRFYERYQAPTLADDSGLECEGLGGAPGVLTANFHQELTWPARWQKIIRSLDGRSKVACFRVVLCYYDGIDVPHFFHGFVNGEISEAPRGEKGFGYDPIFLLPSGTTLAELSPEQKNKISHRAMAARRFLAYFQSLDQGRSER